MYFLLNYAKKINYWKFLSVAKFMYGATYALLLKISQRLNSNQSFLKEFHKSALLNIFDGCGLVFYVLNLKNSMSTVVLKCYIN